MRLPAVVCGSLLLREPLRPDRAGFRPRDAGPGRGRAGADAAGDRRRVVAHDHRRPVHLLLGLGAGARPPGRSSAAPAWAWPLAGLVVGLGILAKYTMVLWLPSVGLFLLTHADLRRLLLRPGFWIMSAVAGLCCLPILVWNLQHDWVTFRHVSAAWRHRRAGRSLAGAAGLHRRPGGSAARLLVRGLGGGDAAAHIRWAEHDAGRALPVVAVGADVPGVSGLQRQGRRRRTELAGDRLPVRPGAGGRLAGRPTGFACGVVSATGVGDAGALFPAPGWRGRW